MGQTGQNQSRSLSAVYFTEEAKKSVFYHSSDSVDTHPLKLKSPEEAQVKMGMPKETI